MLKVFLRNKIRVSLFTALFILLAFSGSSLADVRLILNLPEDVDPAHVTLDVFAGAMVTSAGSSGMAFSSFPTTVGSTLNNLTMMGRESQSGRSYSWVLNQPGVYSYLVRPNPANRDEGRAYAVHQVIWVAPSNWPGGSATYKNGEITATLERPVLTGLMSKYSNPTDPGFEGTFNPNNPGMGNSGWFNSSYNDTPDTRDRVMAMFSDEVESAWYSIDTYKNYPVGGYDTPYTKRIKTGAPGGLYQIATQKELMAWLETLAANNPKVHLFSIGKSPTPQLNFDIPLVIVTSTPIPAGATFEEAAAIIRNNGKLTYWHNAQIHANEAGSGEAGCAMIAEMAGDYGTKFLDKIDYVGLPRYNIEGAYVTMRGNAMQGLDMNRDHMRLQSPETRIIHYAYLHIMPHLALDGHEYDNFTVSRGSTLAGTSNPAMAQYSVNSYARTDAESTPASSMNNPSWEVNDLAYEMFAGKMYDDLWDEGATISNYGETANNAIGRAWMGLMGSITFVFEGRGLGGSTWNFDRRTHAYVWGAKSLLETAYANFEEVKTKIDAGRQRMIDIGKVYNPNEVIALAFGTSTAQTATRPGKNSSVYRGVQPAMNMDGSRTVGTRATTTRVNNITTSRPRPTAYIIPKGITGTPLAEGHSSTISATNQYSINYNYLLDLLGWQGIYYYEVAPGTSVTARQYYRTDTSNTTSLNAGAAGLRAAALTAFPDGAYVVPMDQVTGAVIAMTFEPDITGSNSYNSTVAQSGSPNLALITHNLSGNMTQTRNYPYYRLELDNPREVLPEPYTEVEVFPTADGINVVVFEYFGNGDLKEVLLDEMFPQPTMEGYTFKDWDIDYSNGKLTVTPQFEINKYTVSFVNWDGAVLSEQTIEHGSSAVAPANPQRTGYTFTGWNAAFSNVTGPLTVTAQFEINKYDVVFLADGSVFNTQTVNYGSAATDPGVPYKENYTFTGWNADFSSITANLTVTALFKANLKSAVPTAFVDKISGNKNDLTVTVTETYYDGVVITFTKTFSIDNNAAGTYVVGPYKVYVDTKGNTQIRACYIVE